MDDHLGFLSSVEKSVFSHRLVLVGSAKRNLIYGAKGPQGETTKMPLFTPSPPWCQI
jgi:hypothetical protein